MAPSEQETVEYIHEHIREVLYEGLEAQWEEVLAERDGPAAQKTSVCAYVEGLRNRVWASLKEIGFVAERQRGVIVQHLELKSRWTMLNVQIRHQPRQDAVPADEVLYRATCLSLVVETLEPLLTQERVDSLAEMLSEPLQDGMEVS